MWSAQATGGGRTNADVWPHSIAISSRGLRIGHMQRWVSASRLSGFFKRRVSLCTMCGPANQAGCAGLNAAAAQRTFTLKAM